MTIKGFMLYQFLKTSCCNSLNNKEILFYNQKGNCIFATDSKKDDMAVLGQIRQRSVFLILVIGMALFAFVISGVFDGNSAGGGPSEPIAVVNDEEIELTFIQAIGRKYREKLLIFYDAGCKYCLGSIIESHLFSGK